MTLKNDADDYNVIVGMLQEKGKAHTKIFLKVKGGEWEKYIDTLSPIVHKIRSDDEVMEKLSDQELREQTDTFINRIQKG